MIFRFLLMAALFVAFLIFAIRFRYAIPMVFALMTPCIYIVLAIIFGVEAFLSAQPTFLAWAVCFLFLFFGISGFVKTRQSKSAGKK
jgi:hypothetical protein